MARLSPLEFRRLLRKKATDAEHELWSRLRRHRMGPRFRRQHTAGPYTLDFYCPAAKLAIELDGGQHYDGPQRDRDVVRDAWLGEQGMIWSAHARSQRGSGHTLSPGRAGGEGEITSLEPSGPVAARSSTSC